MPVGSSRDRPKGTGASDSYTVGRSEGGTGASRQFWM